MRQWKLRNTACTRDEDFATEISMLSLLTSVTIAYDRQVKSDLFTKTAAEVFKANGI